MAAARAGGATWQQIADVLGVTRQAVFKRFGHAMDPVTGRDLIPAETADVAALASDCFERLAAGDIASVRARMTQSCARALTMSVISEVWGSVVEDYGPLVGAQASAHDRDGQPAASPQTPLPAVGRVALHFEHGRAWAHVLVNRAGKVSGLMIRPEETPESWPL